MEQRSNEQTLFYQACNILTKNVLERLKLKEFDRQASKYEEYIKFESEYKRRPFELVVLGDTNSGKSTLMNTLNQSESLNNRQQQQNLQASVILPENQDAETNCIWKLELDLNIQSQILMEFRPINEHQDDQNDQHTQQSRPLLDPIPFENMNDLNQYIEENCRREHLEQYDNLSEIVIKFRKPHEQSLINKQLCLVDVAGLQDGFDNLTQLQDQRRVVNYLESNCEWILPIFLLKAQTGGTFQIQFQNALNFFNDFELPIPFVLTKLSMQIDLIRNNLGNNGEYSEVRLQSEIQNYINEIKEQIHQLLNFSRVGDTFVRTREFKLFIFDLEDTNNENLMPPIDEEDYQDQNNEEEGDPDQSMITEQNQEQLYWYYNTETHQIICDQDPDFSQPGISSVSDCTPIKQYLSIYTKDMACQLRQNRVAYRLIEDLRQQHGRRMITNPYKNLKAQELIQRIESKYKYLISTIKYSINKEGKRIINRFFQESENQRSFAERITSIVKNYKDNVYVVANKYQKNLWLYTVEVITLELNNLQNQLQNEVLNVQQTRFVQEFIQLGQLLITPDNLSSHFAYQTLQKSATYQRIKKCPVLPTNIILWTQSCEKKEFIKTLNSKLQSEEYQNLLKNEFFDYANQQLVHYESKITVLLSHYKPLLLIQSNSYAEIKREKTQECIDKFLEHIDFEGADRDLKIFQNNYVKEFYPLN
eukprot:403373254